MDDHVATYKTIDKAAYFRKIGYKPHPKQILYHNSTARFRMACCGRRFGKSRMAAADVEPDLLVPRRRVWAVGPTYDLSEKEFRYVWNDMVIGQKLGRNKQLKKAYNKKQGDMYIEFPWQTRFECRSAQHPDDLVGEGLHRVIMSEAAKHRQDTFERYIQASLADSHGSADFPTTPEGFNWFYKMFQLGLNPTETEYASWQFPSWSNPFVFPGGRDDPEILRVERNSAKAWFLQEYGADFTAFVGKIYEAFQEGIHVRSHTFRPDWPNYIGFDWGYTNPMAAIEFQISPMDEVFVWREHYKPYTRLEDFLEELKREQHTSGTPNPPGYRLDLCFGDAADPEAALTVCEKFAPCYALPEAKQNWREGVNLVSSFLKVREPGDFIDLSEMVEDGDLYDEVLDAYRIPAFFVDPACVNMIREFNNYKAPPSRTEVNPREAAQKYDDHALDAIRYALMHLFKLGARNHSLADVYAGIATQEAIQRELHSRPIEPTNPAWSGMDLLWATMNTPSTPQPGLSNESAFAALLSLNEMGFEVPDSGTFFSMESMP